MKETYGNAATSSDDDYTDSPGPRKRRRKITRNNATVSTNGDAPMTQNGLNTKDMNQELKEIKPPPKKRILQKSSAQGTNVSPAKTNARSSGSGSKPRLGEAVTQVSFRELLLSLASEYVWCPAVRYASLFCFIFF